jgi:p-aminobenzoyl-glutamate transporter AbgT
MADLKVENLYDVTASAGRVWFFVTVAVLMVSGAIMWAASRNVDEYWKLIEKNSKNEITADMYVTHDRLVGYRWAGLAVMIFGALFAFGAVVAGSKGAAA